MCIYTYVYKIIFMYGKIKMYTVMYIFTTFDNFPMVLKMFS